MAEKKKAEKKELKLVSKNGYVDFVTKAGKDYVRCSMPIDEAERLLLQNGTQKVEGIDGYTFECGKYFFKME